MGLELKVHHPADHGQRLRNAQTEQHTGELGGAYSGGNRGTAFSDPTCEMKTITSAVRVSSATAGFSRKPTLGTSRGCRTGGTLVAPALFHEQVRGVRIRLEVPVAQTVRHDEGDRPVVQEVRPGVHGGIDLSGGAGRCEDAGSLG